MYFVILIVLFLAFLVCQLFLKAKVVNKRLPTVPKFDGSKPFLWKNFIKTWKIFERCVGEEAAEVIFFNEALSGAANTQLILNIINLFKRLVSQLTTDSRLIAEVEAYKHLNLELL